jgi:hypothetical protein
MFFALALSCVGMYGQTVSSSLVGTVVDPADAVVSNAPVTLTDTATKATRSATTDNTGTFRFLQLDPGVYNLTVRATGFKATTVTNMNVAAQETHNAGKITLTLGSVSDSVSVTAEISQIQLASAEKSSTINTADLESLTLKGRDLFGYMRLVPGVIDTGSQGRDVTGPNQIKGFTIQGNSTLTMNFTVDGISDMDTGSNSTLHYEPNMDAVQELKILTSNYQAEFGRNSGGTITVVTKNGTSDFHGSFNWSHRHEEFNANSWANNHNLKNINGQNVATPRSPYRYNIETYSIGGPLYIPKVANKEKKHLFFFWSQEYTGQFVPANTQTTYMPTALERMGDFSQTFGNNGNGGKLFTPILDPQHGNIPFSGNVIPQSQLDPLGQSILNFFPLPNNPVLPANQVYTNNFQATDSAAHPRRNDVARIDFNITQKLSGYARWIHDYDDMGVLYSGINFGPKDQNGRGNLPPISNIDHPNPGHSYSGTLTYTITPTLINEITVGESWNTWSYYTTDNYASENRSLIPNIPTLFPIPTADQSGPQGPVNGYNPILPQFDFSSVNLPNGSNYARAVGTSSGTYENFNPIHSYQDNISKVIGHHAFKAGAYLELNNKIQPASKQYNGQYNFNASAGNPLLNSNSGYVLALLGQTSNYQQATATTTFNAQYYNFEFYIQDNWKVSRKLTLDLGVRFYHQTPQYDLNKTFTNFSIANFDRNQIPHLYRPFCTGGGTCSSAANGLMAQDPFSGALVSSGFIGAVVPGTGNYTNGVQVLGVNGVDQDPYKTASIVAAPRIGFAYDLFGDGKTAVRGGWGVFYDRLQGNDVYGLAGNAPLSYSQSVGNLSFAQIRAQTAATAPTPASLTLQPLGIGQSFAFPGEIPHDGVQNVSFDIQHNFGKGTTLDVGYQFNYAFNQPLTYNENYIPVGGAWPFTPSNLNPTTGGTTSADIGQVFERTRYPGLNGITTFKFVGHTNYNGLNVLLQRRVSRGLAVGLNYTYSKAMGDVGTVTGNGTYCIVCTGLNGLPTNEQWNYGRQASDRTHNLVVNYTYDIPGPAKALHLKGVGYITDNWSLSGITSVQSGVPYSPTCGFTSGSPSTVGGTTGTPDLSSRCSVVGDPYANIGTNGNGQVYFNGAAFATPSINYTSLCAPATNCNFVLNGAPALGNLGGGSGILSAPHVTNFDMTLTKNIPLGSEKRILRIQAQAYNVFNHTEIGKTDGTSAINAGGQYSFTTNQLTNGANLGFLNSAVNARILAFTARVQF